MSEEVEVSLHGGTDATQSGGTIPASATASAPPEIYVAASVIDEIDVHVSSDTTVEQGGVLVGRFDERARRVVITGSIRAEGAISKVASLTFTHETWDHVSTVQERDYPGTQMVGWYHSHPHFGVFLSDHDLFIHRNFFSQPWQVAYVVDPLLHQRGFFGWDGAEITRYQSWHVTQGNEVAESLAVDVPARGEEPPPPRPNTPRSTIIGLVIAALLAGAIAGYLAGSSGDSPAQNSLEGSGTTWTLHASKPRDIPKNTTALEGATNDTVEPVPVTRTTGGSGATADAVEFFTDQEQAVWQRSADGITNKTAKRSCQPVSPDTTKFGIGVQRESSDWIVWTVARGRLASYSMSRGDGGGCGEEETKLQRAVSTFAVYGDDAWAVADHEVFRIDRTNSKPQQVPHESGVTSIAAGPAGVWAIRSSGEGDRLDYIDNSTGAPRSTWSMPVTSGAEISADATGVWVSRGADGQLTHLTADGHERSSDLILREQASIAAAPKGGVWVADNGKLNLWAWSECKPDAPAQGSCELDDRAS